MTNITFSVNDELHKKMKEYPEIKWSEILRRAIQEYLKKLEEPDKITVEELRSKLDKETLNQIDKLDLEKEIDFFKKTKEMESERLKSLIELARSSKK